MSDSVIEKLMLQYLVPFKQISMKQVAGTFGMNQSFCNQMIIKMIKQNTIPFLIDSINNVNFILYIYIPLKNFRIWFTIVKKRTKK